MVIRKSEERDATLRCIYSVLHLFNLHALPRAHILIILATLSVRDVITTKDRSRPSLDLLKSTSTIHTAHRGIMLLPVQAAHISYPLLTFNEEKRYRDCVEIASKPHGIWRCRLICNRPTPPAFEDTEDGPSAASIADLQRAAVQGILPFLPTCA